MKSHNIAVAGGAGKLGRHIVEGFLEIKAQHLLHVVALSRSQHEDIWYGDASAPVIAVDYQDPESIRKVLEEHHIDTVISTLSDLNEHESFISAQSNLLQAALAVPSFHRFAPSEFSVDSEQLYTVTAYTNKYPILRSLEKTKRERLNSFEYTRFNCGVFMNYLGFGNTKPNGEKVHGHLAQFPYIFDLSKRTADIPGDGSNQFVITRVEDVGKFVAAATQLEAWEEYSDMAGDVLTYNETLKLCESVCGAKFDVKYSSKEEIVANLDPSPVGFEKIMHNFQLELSAAIADGHCDLKRPINLNKLVDVKPVGLKEFLEQWWGQ